MVGDEVAGSCSVDEEGRLLRFYVLPRFQHRSVALLCLALRELEATCMMVYTLDPNYLSSAMDVASRVEPHTLLFASVTEPEQEPATSSPTIRACGPPSPTWPRLML